MAVSLQYSTDRGSNWTTISTYTHPTSAGVHTERVEIGMIFAPTDTSVRFRLYGTDAANWGLFDWKLEAPVTAKQEQNVS